MIFISFVSQLGDFTFWKNTFLGWDVLSLFIFAALVVIAGFFFSRNRLNVILVSAYLSFLFLKIVPWNQLPLVNFKSEFSPSAAIFLFLGIIALFYLFLPNSFLGVGASRKIKSKWWQLSLYSLLVFGMLAAVILNLLPEKITAEFSSLTSKIFLSDLSLTIWLILPLIGGILFRRKK